jgi:serine/threonine protein kinase
MSLITGSKLGPYEILAPIGAGGMGEVWKERDTRLGPTVAIKKVNEHHSGRFKQEARTIAALNHPYICQLYDIGLRNLLTVRFRSFPGCSHLSVKPNSFCTGLDQLYHS